MFVCSPPTVGNSRSALFWNFTHLRMVIPTRTFCATYRSHLQRSISQSSQAVFLGCLITEDGNDSYVAKGLYGIIILRRVKSPTSGRKERLLSCYIFLRNVRVHFTSKFTLSKGKGKVIPLQARCGPEGG